MKIALVLRPNKKIDLKIKNLKKFFKKNNSKCLYVEDFPHLTLFTMNTSLKKIDLEKINLRIPFKKLNIKIEKPDIFMNDIIVGGKTFFFRIKKNENLFKLQNFTVKVFKKYFTKEKKKQKFDKKSPEYKSYKNYGFPFVGKHWIPHISVCSVLDKKINNQVMDFFYKTDMNLNFNVNKLSLCFIKKNNLIEIKKINFK